MVNRSPIGLRLKVRGDGIFCVEEIGVEPEQYWCFIDLNGIVNAILFVRTKT